MVKLNNNSNIHTFCGIQSDQWRFARSIFLELFIISLILLMVASVNASFPMRTGGGSIVDQEESQERRSLHQHMDVMKEVANEGLKKFKNAQLIFAFTHSTFLPNWVRQSLPKKVSKKILDFDMKGVEFKFNTPFNKLVLVMQALSRTNGLGEDLGIMEEDPRIRLIRMINGVGFNADADPITHSKTLMSLAMNLNWEDDYGIDREARDQMMAELFSQAGDHVVAFLESSPFVREDVRQEALLSVAQLKRWAGYRARGTYAELIYLGDALTVLKDLRKIDIVEKELSKTKERFIPLMGGLLSRALLDWNFMQSHT